MIQEMLRFFKQTNMGLLSRYLREVLNDGDDLLFLDQLRSDLRSEKQTLNPWVFGEGRQPAKLDSNLDFLPSQIDFRPNDARLVLQTHAWQMHTTGR